MKRVSGITVRGVVVLFLGVTLLSPGVSLAQHHGGHHGGGHHGGGHHGGHGFGHGGHHGFGHGLGHGFGHALEHSIGHGLGRGLGHGHHGHHRAHHFGHYGLGLYFGYGYYDPYYYPYYGWYGRPGHSLYYYGPYGYPSSTYTSVYVQKDKRGDNGEAKKHPRSNHRRRGEGSRAPNGSGGYPRSFPDGVAVPRPLVVPDQAPAVLPPEEEDDSSNEVKDQADAPPTDPPSPAIIPARTYT